jgi:hypothetical protein
MRREAGEAVHRKLWRQTVAYPLSPFALTSLSAACSLRSVDEVLTTVAKKRRSSPCPSHPLIKGDLLWALTFIQQNSAQGSRERSGFEITRTHGGMNFEKERHGNLGDADSGYPIYGSRSH